MFPVAMVCTVSADALEIIVSIFKFTRGAGVV
jgi:hypothetical protein